MSAFKLSVSNNLYLNIKKQPELPSTSKLRLLKIIINGSISSTHKKDHSDSDFCKFVVWTNRCPVDIHQLIKKEDLEDFCMKCSLDNLMSSGQYR